MRNLYMYCRILLNILLKEKLEDTVMTTVLKNLILTYTDVSNNLKIKVFDIERSNEDIVLAKNKVIECREYISTLLNQIK